MESLIIADEKNFKVLLHKVLGLIYRGASAKTKRLSKHQTRNKFIPTAEKSQFIQQDDNESICQLQQRDPFEYNFPHKSAECCYFIKNRIMQRNRTDYSQKRGQPDESLKAR